MNFLGGGIRDCPATICVCDVYLFSNSSSPMALGPLRCSVEVHCTTVFALRNSKFSRLGG